MVELGFELATPGSAVRRATDCAMEPDPDTLPYAYQYCPLTLKALSRTAAGDILFCYCYYFSEKKKDLAFHVNRQTIHMKCQALFSLKNENKKNNISSAADVISALCVNPFNSFPSGGDFCRLLIAFANRLDPDQPGKTSGLIWIQTL